MSTPPDYHRFDATRMSDTALTDLDPLGIVVRDHDGPVTYWIDADGELWKRIGRITVRDDGVIDVWPHTDISDDDLDDLRGAGCEAFNNPPSARNHWTRHETRGYWDCLLSVLVNMIPDQTYSREAAAPIPRQLEHAA